MNKIIISILFVLILVSCGVDVLTGIKSPDKSKIVMAYTKRVGISRTYVSIEEKTGKNKKILLICKGIIPISFKWIDNKELNINIPNNINIEKKDLKYKKIKINLNPSIHRTAEPLCDLENKEKK